MSAAVKFEALLEAFELSDFGGACESQTFLCRETGAFHYVGDIEAEDPPPEDIDDPEKYIALPDKRELDLGSRLALRFAAEAVPQFEWKVRQIFSRPGAYARFKDLLEYNDLLQKWYDYESEATASALRRWCRDNEIVIEG